MRGGAGPNHSDDQFRPDFRGGFGDRGMRGRGMRGTRGGMDGGFRGGFQTPMDNQDFGADSGFNGSGRVMRGGMRGDLGGRGKSASRQEMDTAQ